MAHLFFSYAHADYDRLLPVFQRMELITERMIWIDRIGLQRDAEWAAMIERAIKSSYGVIFAVTKAFVERPFILDKEIPWAIERFNDSRQGKLVFPILFDDVPLPATLTGANVQFCKQVLDARDGDTERVIHELKSMLPEVPPSAGDEYPFVVSWPRLRNFKGRDQQLVELHHAMHTEDGKAGIKTAGMYGTGGIGKTQLAVEFVYRYRFYFPGGVFWINAARNWQSEIVDCADHLGLKPIDPNDTNRNKQMALAFKQYRQESGQDALLILDNVENPGDLATREIAPKLTIPDLCRETRTRLILTTRVQTLPEGFTRIEVSKLNRDDAQAVLLDAWQAGSDTPPRTDSPDDTVLDMMAQLFDYLPLPLGWMAAALRQKPTLPPARLLDNLHEQGVDETIGRLKQAGVVLGTPAYYEALIGAGLDWQIAQCDNPRMLHLLALIAAYDEAAIIPTARLRRLVDFAPDELFDPFDEAIATLQKYSLVETHRSGAAFRLHPLEHAYLRRLIPDYRARLSEAARALLRAYRTPDSLVQETLARGFDAVLIDLRETELAIPTNSPVFDTLKELRRYLDWESYHLREQYPEENSIPDRGQYLIQHLRERAHHQGTDDALRNACDEWLTSLGMAYFRSNSEWRYPYDPGMIRIFDDLESPVWAVAFAPDGRTAVSGSNILQLWDVASGTELRRFEGHDVQNRAVAFAPNGRTILSGDADGTLSLWDVDSGAELRRFEGHSDSIRAVAFAPDAHTALSGSDDYTLRLWDVASGVELRRFEGHRSGINAVAFAPDGRTALSGSKDTTLRLWDVASGVELRRFEGHRSGINAVAFAPDGRTALSGSGSIIGSDNTLRLWDVTSGNEIRRFEGHNNYVSAVAFAPDGHTVLSSSWDKTLRLWKVDNGEELRRFEGHNNLILTLAFAPTGQIALSGSIDNTLRLWDIGSLVDQCYFEGHAFPVWSVAFAPDGRTVLSGSTDQTMRLWNLVSRKEVCRFQGHEGSVIAVAYAPKNHTVLSGSADKTLRLWDIGSGTELRRFEGHADSVFAVAFAPDGLTVLSGSEDCMILLWDVATGWSRRLFKGHQARVNAVAFAPDGRTILSGSGDGTLRLWDVANEAELRCFRGHSHEVTTVAFAPDGRTILSGSRDTTLRLWDVANGSELRRFQGHSHEVTTVAFAPDGRTILSGSRDTTLRLWDVASGQLLDVLKLASPLTSLAITYTIPLSIVVGDEGGIVWGLQLYIP